MMLDDKSALHFLLVHSATMQYKI